ncbi:MAG: hypothetical protein ABSE51_19960 [Terracidiphilus sp.]
MRIFVRSFIVALVAILVAIGAAPAIAQNNSPAGQTYSQHWLWAADFGQWTLRAQTAQTYSWSPGTICYTSANGSASAFFMFATTQPVEIVDLTNASLNEIKTPGSVTLTNATCSLGISPSNTHYSFYLTSGTAGLQEAINSVSATAPYPTDIFLDRNWYAQAYSLPGTTPAAVIAAATGNANTVVVDTTTQPFTFYTYNGTGFSASGSTVAFPNAKVSSYTNISPPAAVSTASVTTSILTTSATGGTIASGAGTFRVAQTYVDASGGETLISTDSAGTSTIAIGSTTSTNSITVTSPPAATGAVGWRLYITAAGGGTGSEILYTPTCSSTVAIANQVVFPPATVCPIGASGTVGAIITGTATVPVVNNAYPRLAGSSGAYPPFTALGSVSSGTTSTLGVINIPAGYLNVLGRQVTACGNGYATNSATTGSVALNVSLASVPGVTSITPFTASYTTATTTAVQVPFDFCVTVTTASTGTSGTLEVHGWVNARPATSGAGVAGVTVVDNIFAVSSAVNLVTQDQIALTITPTTTALTAAQLRQLSLIPSN